jgi:hypothetical protein
MELSLTSIIEKIKTLLEKNFKQEKKEKEKINKDKNLNNTKNQIITKNKNNNFNSQLSIEINKIIEKELSKYNYYSIMKFSLMINIFLKEDKTKIYINSQSLLKNKDHFKNYIIKFIPEEEKIKKEKNEKTQNSKIIYNSIPNLYILISILIYHLKTKKI